LLTSRTLTVAVTRARYAEDAGAAGWRRGPHRRSPARRPGRPSSCCWAQQPLRHGAQPHDTRQRSRRREDFAAVPRLAHWQCRSPELGRSPARIAGTRDSRACQLTGVSTAIGWLLPAGRVTAVGWSSRVPPLSSPGGRDERGGRSRRFAHSSHGRWGCCCLPVPVRVSQRAPKGAGDTGSTDGRRTWTRPRAWVRATCGSKTGEGPSPGQAESPGEVGGGASCSGAGSAAQRST
jgi:hypothetical protein